jgi:hypothetical protein
MSSNDEIADVVEAARAEVAAGDFGHPAWGRARPVGLARYWSGEEAPAGRRGEARVVWGEGGLTVRFDCRQAEPPVVSAAPRLDRKTIGLWERDVCEIFVAPDPSTPGRYYEFEAAPTGEWLDLAITLGPEGRETDWLYRSGMTATASLRGPTLTVGIHIPWSAFGIVPRAGERWRANLFRCVGAGPSRGYLAWRPTHTPEPSFHVPEKFGWIKFN